MTSQLNILKSAKGAILSIFLILGLIASAHASDNANLLARKYIITASAGPGGTISPSGEVEVRRDRKITFKITADHDYSILDVVVDGKSVGPVKEYKFSKVKEDHTITASFSPNFGIQNVTIPNVSMKIGDVISATLDVVDDQGTAYSLVSGAIGGYPLMDFQRISATTYRAEFTIIQGGNSYSEAQDIPVSDLIISNGTEASAAYNRTIKQDSDLLDAELPVIHSMRVDEGTMKIGDVVDLVIEADGIAYSINPGSTINGIGVGESNISFTETGDGNYRIRYTVREGDSDAGQGNPDLGATVILIKPSGNQGMPYSTVTNNSNLSIDAHAPQITRMIAPSLEVGVGGIVRITVSADGTAYTAGSGTTVNGVALSSSRVSVIELSDGSYELSYRVAVEDGDAAPGTMQASISLVDAAGNTGDSYAILEPNMLEIYTDLPEAALGADPQICEGEETELSVFLTGRSPWSFDLDDGSSTTSFTNISSSTYKINIIPVQSTNYQITAVRDVNDVENSNISEILIDVNELEEAEFLNLASGYNVEANPFKLEASVPGGVFSGPGVFSETGYFYPGIADTLNSPHTIYYTYEDQNHCSSMTSKLVHVLGANGAVLIPEDIVCSNDVPFTTTVVNVPGVIGTFSLLNSDSEPVTGLEDHGDNSATIDPGLLESENYTIEYQYLDQVTLYLRKSFSIESVTPPQILALDENSLCQNADPFELRSDLSNVIFEGPGVSGNMFDGFVFNPREADPGNISISCTAISEHGCKASVQENLNIKFSPEVLFEFSSECIPEDGEIVSFDNQTSGKSSIESWSWDFGDIGSGQDNHSELINPMHHYKFPGQKTISLTALTFDGCVAAYELETLIDSKPMPDFSWNSECFSSDSEVRFVNKTTHGSASLDTIIWTFFSHGGEFLGEVGSNSTSDTVAFPFFTANNYQVSLYTRNRGGCFSEITKEIALRPTIQLDSEGYNESFDESEGMWAIRSVDQVESWVWGVPDFIGHSPTAGDYAWFTRLPAATGHVEHSWIQSPCFNFSTMERPLIQMDVMRSFVPDINGAVLQYRENSGESWITVGKDTPGIGWYNIPDLSNKPGGSSTGWGLDVFNPDSDWVRAIHDLDQVAGKANVTFRIAIASSGQQSINNQGFAFNNVVVAERSKVSVIEHFTSNTSHTSWLADELIDDLAKTHYRDVIDLQYHMDIGGTDPMNLNNPLPSARRAFNYGVPEVPYTVFDGGVEPQHRYNYLELKSGLAEDELRLLSLENPAFSINLGVDWQSSRMEAYTEVSCLADRFENPVLLYLVVFETSVTAYTGGNGDTHFRNVVLDILPPPAGQLLGDYWRNGKSEAHTLSWSYQPYVEDIQDLAVVAFIQDRTTGQILQAAVDYKDQTVDIPAPDSEPGDLSIYPNPTQDIIYINLGKRTDHAGRIEVTDLNGRRVLDEQISAGVQIFSLDVNHLQRGLYIIRWMETEHAAAKVARMVKTR